MTPTALTRSTQATVASLVVAILGVVALDVTSIVTAPNSSSANASAAIRTKSQIRLLRWAGVTWQVVPATQTGPDNDPMSASHAAAHVDSRGRLHLAVTKVKGVWRSVELIDPSPAKYGTYRFEVTASLSTLARPLDLGMFVIRPGAPELTNEVDLEDSRALIGMHHGRDAQYVVQPYTKAHHIMRYVVSRKVTTTQQSFDWRKRDVRFLTLGGAGKHARRLAHLHYHGPDSPTPSKMSLHINLFNHGNTGTVKAGPRSVILDSFKYTPAK